MCVFNYVAGNDNVVRVNGSDFQSCSLTKQVWSTGDDLIQFTTTGRRWYISGVADHCQRGQKLFLTVQPSQLALSPVPSSPSPSPIPAPEAVASDAPWSPSPVPSPSASLSPSPSPTPAHEAAVSDAPWTAPRRSLMPKKLFKMIHRNLIGV
ncbi:hypothetical protein TSUD_327640 [Trifolium subterraneum]|uniref:Phytocyanin domain-containing protein n=1 Tax=Trifolium subterraneum TaxID=3900 RepID=A0A2Z6M1M3_TRISU|nr:hypothetical protein TSUD_327640 [Trifolium subterraneum]